MMTNQSKRFFPLLLHFVLVLNALVRKSSDLLEFNQTHNHGWRNLFQSGGGHVQVKKTKIVV